MTKSQPVLKIFFALVLVAAGFFLLKDPTFPGAFEVINNTHKIQFSNPQDFSGAVMVNLDETEEEEIFISGVGSSNLMLKRVGENFVPMNIPQLSDSQGLTFSVTPCDLDQDGRDEILLLNRSNQTQVSSKPRIVKYSSGVWKDLLEQEDPIADLIAAGYSATCVDRKGDGKYGLAITPENGKLAYLELVDSKVVDVAQTIGMTQSSKGRSILPVPSPSGKMNLFVGNEDGANFYFVNNGDGTFLEKASEVGLADPLFNARGISLIDINYDDLPDLVYGNNFGPTRLMEQTREGSFIDVATEEMRKSYAVNAAVVGDFNLDGFEDIYLNNIRGDNRVFARFEKDWFELVVDLLKEKEMFGISTLTGDLDKNGSVDILNTHGDGSTFPVTFYSIKPVNPWIKFSPKFKTGGVARGAILKLRTNLRDHMRVVSSGSGRFANYDSEIMVGLATGERLMSVEVLLPSGMKIDFKGPFEPMKSHPLVF
jgi:FG-GAP-like repeat